MTDDLLTPDVIGSDSIEHYHKYGGEEYRVVVEQITLGVLEGVLDEDLTEAEELTETRRLIDEYLLEPRVDARELTAEQAAVYIEAMEAAWAATDDEIEAAFDETRVPDEGNGTRRRRRGGR